MFLMVIVAFVVYVNIARLIETAQWVDHTQKVIADARDLGKLIVDMETGERGFLITGKEAFLDPFTQAQRVWNNKIMELKSIVSDNPEQVSRIEEIDGLAKQWLKVAAQPEINARIESIKTGETMDNVIALVNANTGKKIIDTIRMKLDEFISVEAELMNIRELESKNTASNTIIVTIVSTTIAILLALFSALLISATIAGGLRVLVERTKEISSGNFSGMIKVKSYDEIGALAGAFNSMTEHLQESRNELERSNQELEQFAYVASHDLQEPLRMVASYMQLLERRYKGKLDSEADEFIGFAVDGATRMQRLINDLLAYSRIGTRGKDLKLTDCSSVLETSLANLRKSIDESGATVTHDILPTVMADAIQLTQLFQNLVGNAIKFRGNDPPRIHVSAAQKKNELLFSVSDNGIGIDPEHADRIFIIFQRLHGRGQYPGTGIGLAICKKIAERHGGRLWVESQPGRGSTFYFTISMKGAAKHE